MALSKDRKSGIIGTYKTHDTDTGSPEVQVALLSDQPLDERRTEVAMVSCHLAFQVIRKCPAVFQVVQMVERAKRTLGGDIQQPDGLPGMRALAGLTHMGGQGALATA